MSLIPELQRRNVIRVATAYVVAAWLIIQVAETTFPVFGFSANAVRVVIIILGIGFVPAIVGAWVFQLTPDGLKRDKGADQTPAVSKFSSRNLDRAIIVTLVLGISYFALDKFVLAPDRAAEREAEVAAEAKAEAVTGFYGDRSIAVLPFDNMSSDPEQEYFADGIAEEVLNLLARIRDVRVISRSSAFAFKGQDLEISEIAARLNVAHILEGSVRKMGNTVRVTAQLIDARTNTPLWSHIYEHELDNAFQIQDEIAADVVANLQIKLPKPLPGSRHIDPEVRSLTERAKELVEIRPEGVGGKMYTLLSRALEIDPDYVPALILMTAADWFRHGEGLITEEEELRRYEEIYARVQKLDPDNGFLDAADAFDRTREGKLEEAATLYSRSLSKDLTDSNNIRLAGLFARRLGKLDVSVRLLEHALAIDPLCHQCRIQLARSLMFTRDYERARREQERYMANSDGWPEVYAQILLLDAKPQGALEYILTIERDEEDPHQRPMLLGLEAMARHSLGETARADALLEELIADDFFDRRTLSLRVAQTAAWLGKKDLAFERLFEMAPTNFNHLKGRVFSPEWDTLRDDPRWLEFLAASEMSPERLDAIEFDPDLPE